MSENLPLPRRDLFPILTERHLKPIEPNEPLARAYFRRGPYPANWNAFRFYGPVHARFDHHPPPAGPHPRRGIMYGAPHDHATLHTCLLELFQKTRRVNRHRHNPHFTVFTTKRSLLLLDLNSSWLTSARGNSAIFSGNHDLARRWSREIYLHYRGQNAVYLNQEGEPQEISLDGLLYQSSLRPLHPCLALYERARDAILTTPLLDIPLADSSLDRPMESLSEVGLELAGPF